MWTFARKTRWCQSTQHHLERWNIFCYTFLLSSIPQIIRQMFPNLTTRRLGKLFICLMMCFKSLIFTPGTRGKSRYHYYGLAVKEGSPYYNATLTRREAIQGWVERHTNNGAHRRDTHGCWRTLQLYEASNNSWISVLSYQISGEYKYKSWSCRETG